MIDIALRKNPHALGIYHHYMPKCGGRKARSEAFKDMVKSKIWKQILLDYNARICNSIEYDFQFINYENIKDKI